ncbi:hypothetical protein KS4_16120 [Poriferisphaera corsica]|uniref:Uncharacterized protein n=1 Tax=Poriferisphaera corsica TaxID=2528020 RepID=A0A517YTK3_9BACT|nr:hypothetical protein [Poriferisphaera corsica]QDU33561.1 hypothetical protein KS4_16120 [Poriferisphaera corsica]
MAWTEDQLMDYMGWQTKPVDEWGDMEWAAFYEQQPNAGSPAEYFAWHGAITEGTVGPDTTNWGEVFVEEYGDESEKMYGVRNPLKSYWDNANRLVRLGTIALAAIAIIKVVNLIRR